MEEKIFREKADDLTNDLPRFPSLSSYMNGLNELSRMDLSNMNYDSLARLLYERAIIFQQTFGIRPSHIFNQSSFYRVRMNIKDDEDINLLRTYSYPLPSSCKRNGRANLKGKSVFYCSNHALTSILESKPNAGEIGYLSVWQANTDRDIKYGICLPRDLTSDNEFRFMANDIHKFIDEESFKRAGAKADHFRFFHQYVAERFVNEKEPYFLTSCIANEMLYGDTWRDFIIYPSIANKAYSCNMAFHPNSADTILKFSKVLRFRVESFHNGQISISQGKIGEFINSTIVWRQAKKNELYEILNGFTPF